MGRSWKFTDAEEGRYNKMPTRLQWKLSKESVQLQDDAQHNIVRVNLHNPTQKQWERACVGAKQRIAEYDDALVARFLANKLGNQTKPSPGKDFTSGGSLPSPSKAEESLSEPSVPGTCRGPQKAKTNSVSRTYSGRTYSGLSLSSSGNTSYVGYDQPAGTAPLTGVTLKKFNHDSPAPSTTSEGMDYEEVFGLPRVAATDL